ncbi:P-loop containing nucleoside triphosphate hydrolase protein [Achaetomium macrosporum]|uniref:ATP-dependent RNA helicase n=1 Tax=Achaetomium macrosporum TaxID=79813 RepID=A0AAN7CB84_9PEZI|nr:P-loop containing nucleoside triphosphate hydrolase protein [Achaetomium macrosporum]
MYNRYIPPPKENKASKPLQVVPPAATLAGFSSSKPYARYIPGQVPNEPEPPAPAQRQRIVFDDTDFPPVDHSKSKQAIDDELTGTREAKKAKKSKSRKANEEASGDGGESELKEPKSRKRKRSEAEQARPAERQIEENQDTEEGESEPEPEPSVADNTEAPDTEPPTTSKEERKPKREKKKKKRAENHLKTDEPDAEADEIHKRHRSVFEKVQKALQAKDRIKDADDGHKEDALDEEAAEAEVEHGLEPLPQPDPVVVDESKLTYETLPPWLASPIRVAPDKTQPFTELGIAAESSEILASRGFKDAFAVQTAVLPLLLPSPDRQGDVVVAAPTGSGKTLSYVLPMVHDISKGRVTRLRALIVLPTRDLVQQVQLACEACAAAFAVSGGKRIRIGTAMGNRVFKEEQSAIMAQEQRYDPQGYEQYLQKRNSFVSLNDSDEEDDDLDLDRSEPLPYHVITYASKVDILICTPGRLVEHITKTPGFTLDYVRWLVVDEADKLLAQDFQQWLDIVTEKLSMGKPGARDFPGSNKSGVRKVILSATMTRDLGLLNELKLSRPKLVVVEGTKAGEQSLPALLKEFAIKVREPSLKPLYLVDLLRSKHMAAVNQDDAADAVSAGSETSDSESSSSDSNSDSDSESGSESDSSSSSEDDHPRPTTIKPSPAMGKKPALSTTVLIFTKSNEAALRLSRLLALLSPDLAPLIGTLTSSTKTSRRTRILRGFSQGKRRILVASDLVSRGIDLLNLEHVINYDLPISETSYVHRVGRTARAGRRGCAWALVEHAEARRFWRDFAGEGKGAVTSIVRAGKVERVRIGGDTEEGEFAEDRVREYEAALARLAREAAGGSGAGTKERN